MFFDQKISNNIILSLKLPENTNKIKRNIIFDLKLLRMFQNLFQNENLENSMKFEKAMILR